MSAAGTQLCVVHLARAANGTAPLRAFLESYARHPAGAEHELLLLFKGYGGDGEALPAELEALLGEVKHQRRHIPDRGYDVDAYFEAARAHAAGVYCFLNSYSVILADGWLAKLHRALVEQGAGMVGATGSWQSMSSNYADTRLPGFTLHAAYPAWKRRLLAVLPFLARLLPWLRERLLLGAFEPFPNPHLRTNAFMLARETALGVRVGAMRWKYDAHRFESGRRGLTRQVLDAGKAVLVVGRDGMAYDRADWHSSNTFWRRDQGNLLVADNQTRMYERSGPQLRAVHSLIAWGPAAEPRLERERAAGA